MRFFCISFLLLCLSIKAEAQRYFEGQINYNNNYESLHDQIDANVLAKELGSSFTAYIQPERYALVYNAKGRLGWMKIIIDLKEGYSYTEFEKSDTIQKSDLSKNTAKLINLERNFKPKKEILGVECESVTLDYVPNDPDAFYQTHLGTYYFNPDYKLKTKLYKNYRDGFWNLYVNESKSISLRNEIEYSPLFKIVQEATSIVKMKIDDSMYKLNSEKVITEK